ncbi:L-fucose operon activator [Klebsiella michiganensis]|nr:L-fucose operon activator [Klebsiella michiganensis]
MKAARQQAILDLLINHNSLTTEALSLQLNVSRETIRRDLSELQSQGKVLRNHGRAKVIHRQSRDSGDPFHIRLKSHYAHKADIAREALAWIEEGDGYRP